MANLELTKSAWELSKIDTVAIGRLGGQMDLRYGLRYASKKDCLLWQNPILKGGINRIPLDGKDLEKFFNLVTFD